MRKLHKDIIYVNGIIKTWDEGKGCHVATGKIIKDMYIRYVKPEHFCVKYHGYGIQRNVIKFLHHRSIGKIKFISKRKIMRSLWSQWNRLGVEDDFGNGLQVFLDIDYMNIEDRNK